MKKAVKVVSMLCMIGLLVGCEWESSSTGESLNTGGNYSYVNFSGTYRGANGYLVSEYSTSSAGSSSSAEGERPTARVLNEAQGTAPAGPQTMMSGTLSTLPIVPGSVSIFFGGGAVGSFFDDGSMTLSGTYTFGGGAVQGAGSGTINYNTGAWTVNLALPGLDAAAAITASYSVYIDNGQVVTSGGPVSGASGAAIYAFTVQHNGSSVVITDNNGQQYSGTASPPVFSATGQLVSDSTNAKRPSEGQVIMQFSATGTSLAGFTVNIVGSFQGYYTTDQRLINRTLVATWIEVGGKTGDINGVAQDASSISETDQ